ncbi:uncharacterized protein TNCV_3182461 [Trichonephila clavipes]|uniref:Uncharacterized protein n=1 Tax=Trichonephila clavipes TaxID=2585209 RepID=A0A8X6VG32_TRICX|nr:uncharacterized protein TNCV_3182461 [Trichonephila clavipes]
MASHIITPVVGVVCRSKAKAGLRRSPRFSFLVSGTHPNGGGDGWASRAAHVMCTSIPNVLQPGTLVWFEKTQGFQMKVLPVPGGRQMKQLALSAFLRMWLSSRQLVCLGHPGPFVQMTSLGYTGPNTSSQHIRAA